MTHQLFWLCRLSFSFSGLRDGKDSFMSMENGKKRKKKKTIPHRHSTTVTQADRLATFVDYKSKHVTASAYADAGFSYDAKSDTVQCTSCRLKLTKLRDLSYDPASFQRSRRPDCPYLSKHQDDQSTRSKKQEEMGENMMYKTLHCDRYERDNGICWGAQRPLSEEY